MGVEETGWMPHKGTHKSLGFHYRKCSILYMDYFL